MEYKCMVLFDPIRSHSSRAIKAFVRGFAGARCSPDAAFLPDVETANALYQEARRRGFKCSLVINTVYDYNDAFSGDLGIPQLGPASTDDFLHAKLPKDAFDFSTGCPRCGVGAARVKPHVLSERATRCKANFYDGSETSILFMRSEIGREIIEATGQPWCMRHPVRRDGRVVEEWMEVVPCATMPPLSPKSEGVALGSSGSWGSAGDPRRVIEPCVVCGRQIWDYAGDTPTRLVYAREAVEAAQKHAVVSMYEPRDGFPAFDPVKRSFKDLCGLPWLLFNRTAIKVLLKYAQREHVRDSLSIMPVFSV